MYESAPPPSGAFLRMHVITWASDSNNVNVPLEIKYYNVTRIEPLFTVIGISIAYFSKN